MESIRISNVNFSVKTEKYVSEFRCFVFFSFLYLFQIYDMIRKIQKKEKQHEETYA